jgi:hypothetical protein
MFRLYAATSSRLVSIIRKSNNVFPVLSPLSKSGNVGRSSSSGYQSAGIAPPLSSSSQAPPRGMFERMRTYFRNGGREDIMALGTGAGGVASATAVIYYIVGSMQSSHEKIALLTEATQKERELRDKDKSLLLQSVEKERELRDKDKSLLLQSVEKERELRIESSEKERELRIESSEKERELRIEGIQKERELRDKDTIILKLELLKQQELSVAKQAAVESELRAVKSELDFARKLHEMKGE